MVRTSGGLSLAQVGGTSPTGILSCILSDYYPEKSEDVYHCKSDI